MARKVRMFESCISRVEEAVSDRCGLDPEVRRPTRLSPPPHPSSSQASFYHASGIDFLPIVVHIAALLAPADDSSCRWCFGRTMATCRLTPSISSVSHRLNCVSSPLLCFRSSNTIPSSTADPARAPPRKRRPTTARSSPDLLILHHSKARASTTLSTSHSQQNLDGFKDRKSGWCVSLCRP